MKKNVFRIFIFPVAFSLLLMNNPAGASAQVKKPRASKNRIIAKKVMPKVELAFLPAGEFVMGSDNNIENENPKRRVTISQGFYMGKYEVTQDQWAFVMGKNPSKFKLCGGNCPVERVSWNDIQTFIERINAMNDGFKYRLPSEAEWEYAARAGTTTAYAFGDKLSPWTEANFNGIYQNLKKTAPVGSYAENAFGLYDMHGNVWEWVQDIYKASYEGLATDGSAYIGKGDTSSRVLRGGSWVNFDIVCRSASRMDESPATRDGLYGSYGFRLAANAVTPTEENVPPK